MIAQSWENGYSREHVRHLFDGVLENFQVLFFSLIPYVVRWQITSPKNIIYILKNICNIEFKANFNMVYF